MSAYARLIESVRRTRKTLYLVAGLYVGVGFVVAAITSINGNLLGTFLGFLIISGALSMAIVARTALHVLVRVAHIEESLGDLSVRVDRIIPTLDNESQPGAIASASKATAAVLDLSRIGTGRPEELAAATLDRDVYPRLAASLGDDGVDDVHASDAGPNGHDLPLTTKNLLHSWKTALASGDLLECKRILAAMVDLSDPEDLRPLRLQIEELEDRIEISLRNQFAQQIRDRDFCGSLETGEKFVALLGNRPVAAEFERLRPLLVRKTQTAVAHACVTS